MRPWRPLYRANEVEVWRTGHIEDGGRWTLVFQVWCVATDCQQRGRLGSCHLPDQALSLAVRHRHRLLPDQPAASRVRRPRGLFGLSAVLFVASFLLAATWAALLIHPVTSLPVTP